MGSTPLGNRRSTTNLPCIWAQAGVVARRWCRNHYDCTTCRFDRALRRVSDQNRSLQEQGMVPQGRKGRIVYWKDKLKGLPVWKRPCLHHLKQRIEFKACTFEYRCGNCEFDQYFNDQFAVHAVVRPIDFLDIQGFKVPQGFYLHPGHAWVRIEEGNEVRVGLDDFALRMLGPLDRIEAPLLGKPVARGRADIVMRRGTHEARMLSPVSGVVSAINPALRDEGVQANQDPYSEGWIARIHAADLRQDLKYLMIGAETGRFITAEVEQLYQLIEQQAGPLAADGGLLGTDIFGNMPELGWDLLVRRFLRVEP